MSVGRQRAHLPKGAWAALPAAIALAVWVCVPMAAVFRYATWRWRGFAPPEPAGVENLIRLLRDPDLWSSLATTFTFAAAVLPAFVALSVAIALAIERTRWERFVKALLFAPGVITVGASAIAWYLLYHPDFGVLFELTGLALPWTTAPWAALAYVAAFTLWQQTGYGVLVVSAALRGIPPSVVEAARVDGADDAQVRRLVVLPLLRPTLLFLTVVGTIFALQSTTAVWLLTGGGPFGATRVLGYHLFETAFIRFDLGYGAALTVFVAAITVAVAFAQARLLVGRDATA